MTYRIEKLCKAYSPRLGEQAVWRPTKLRGGSPYEWSTLREAESFLRLFYDFDPTEVRIVEVSENVCS